MRRLLSGYVLLVWSALLLSLVAFLARAWAALADPFELDYGEGVVLWQAQQVTDLKTAYRSVSQFPHLAFNYPPVYHFVSRLVALSTGDLLFAGRLVSILSTLGISVISGLIVWSALPRRMPQSVRAAGAALGAMLCFSLSAMVWADYMRVDMLALFFEFAGLYLYVLGRRRRAFDYGAVLCFSLALFTKPTMIAGPLACGAVAVLTRPKDALRQLGLLIACCTPVFALLEFKTHGEFFRHLVLYNLTSVSRALLLSILKRNVPEAGPVAALALVLPGAFLLRLRSRPRGGRARFRAAMARSPFHRWLAIGGLFLLIACGLSLSAAKAGASTNYMLEWNLAACPLVALLFSDVLYWWHRRQRLLPAHAVLLLCPLVFIVVLGATHFTSHHDDVAEGQEDAGVVLERIRQVGGPVLSTDLVLLYRAGKEPPAEPFMAAMLAERGQWDDTPFADRIASGFFDLIVSSDPPSYRWMYSPRVGAAIEKAYRPSETVGHLTLYRPDDGVRAPASRK